MLRTTLIAITLVSGTVVVVFGYSYTRDTSMAPVDPPTWLWLTAAAVVVLAVGALVARSRLDHGSDDHTLCPNCGARLDCARREGVHSPPDEPWLLLCDRRETEIVPDPT